MRKIAFKKPRKIILKMTPVIFLDGPKECYNVVYNTLYGQDADRFTRRVRPAG
jgi:hypothetical protein